MGERLNKFTSTPFGKAVDWAVDKAMGLGAMLIGVGSICLIIYLMAKVFSWLFW